MSKALCARKAVSNLFFNSLWQADVQLLPGKQGLGTSNGYVVVVMEFVFLFSFYF